MSCLKNKLFNDRENFIIAGPCAAESLDLCIEVSQTLDQICKQNGFTYIFKASYDKANRTSINSYRGPGLEAGREIFKKVKEKIEFVCTDIHLPHHPEFLGDCVDIIQIPAFLCRQTDLVTAAAKSGKVINVKKAQFLSSEKMRFVIEKIKHFDNDSILLTERGSSMGPENLVVDFRNITKMREFGYPVVMDCTHACQQINSGSTTGGNREFAPLFAKSSFIFGATGIFAEVHPDPDRGLSDASNMINYDAFEKMVSDLSKMRKLCLI